MAVAETTFRAMASHVQVIVVDGSTNTAVIARRALAQLESAWSRFIDTSDITRLNNAHGRPVAVDPATVRLIQSMTEAAQLTDGRYDPTVLEALITAGYIASIEDPSMTTTLPTPLHTQTNDRQTICDVVIDHDTSTVTLPAGIAIDAGGLGKGLAADLVVAELLRQGAAGALVSIGGDLAAAGETPHQGWSLDVEHHLDPNRVLTQIVFSGGGVATSSTQSRRWTHGTIEQHHVIDPATGAPSDADLIAVTVIAPCGWHAEAHATALLLGGSADFERYTSSTGIEAIATTSRAETLATAALAELVVVEVTS